MIERTFNYRLISQLASWPIMISRKAIYLLDGKDNLWAFEEYLDGYMIAAEMGTGCRGNKAVKSLKSAFQWMDDNIGKVNIYASRLLENRKTGPVAVAAGMEFTHIEKGRMFYKKGSK